MTTDSDNETQKAEEKHKLAMSELKVKLQSPDYRRDRERFTQHRIQFNSGTWIFSEEKFQSWYCSTDNTILCISGLLGMGKRQPASHKRRRLLKLTAKTGKTVLMSTVANRLLAEKQYFGSETLVGYFLFQPWLARTAQQPSACSLRAIHGPECGLIERTAQQASSCLR